MKKKKKIEGLGSIAKTTPGNRGAHIELWTFSESGLGFGVRVMMGRAQSQTMKRQALAMLVVGVEALEVVVQSAWSGRPVDGVCVRERYSLTPRAAHCTPAPCPNGRAASGGGRVPNLNATP
jgi:hypothetical protein